MLDAGTAIWIVKRNSPGLCASSDPAPRRPVAGNYRRMFANVQDELWVDKQDLGWIKADGKVIQTFSIGLFLVRLLCHGNR